FELVNSGDRSDYDREVPTIIVEAPGYAPEKKVVDIAPKPDPLEFKLSRGRNIKCHVVDSRGNPLTGGWTVIQPFADNRDYDVWLDDTDSKGDFIIPNVAERDVKLTVGKSGFLTIRDYIIGPAENEVTVQMMRTLTIQGTVTDAVTGKLIPNFGIAAIYSRRSSNERPIVFSDGKYELSFDETSALTWHLQASAVGYEQVESEEFNIEEGSKVINFKLPRSSDFEEKSAGQTFQVTRGPSVRIITGVVKDEKDQPVKNAVISTRPWLAEDTLTNDEGKFRIRSTINSGSVGTRSSSLQETTYILARQKERNLSAAIQLDEKTDNYEITLSPGIIFSCKVVDVNGVGIPSADISLGFWISDGGYVSRDPTSIDSQGNFEIKAIPSGY
ncbi:MAG: carboxypeptidase-like regulatory domain-containing protein, partial [Sedimentisphaerales bacterium]